MGYYRLKGLVKQKRLSVRDMAAETGIDLNKLYDCMHVQEYAIKPTVLTEQEKQLLYNKCLKDKTHMTLEEVFEGNGYTGYEFDTVYKSEAVARRKRDTSHKR